VAQCGWANEKRGEDCAKKKDESQVGKKALYSFRRQGWIRKGLRAPKRAKSKQTVLAERKDATKSQKGTKTELPDKASKEGIG